MPSIWLSAYLQIRCLAPEGQFKGRRLDTCVLYNASAFVERDLSYILCPSDPAHKLEPEMWHWSLLHRAAPCSCCEACRIWWQFRGIPSSLNALHDMRGEWSATYQPLWIVGRDVGEWKGRFTFLLLMQKDPRSSWTPREYFSLPNPPFSIYKAPAGQQGERESFILLTPFTPPTSPAHRCIAWCCAALPGSSGWAEAVQSCPYHGKHVWGPILVPSHNQHLLLLLPHPSYATAMISKPAKGVPKLASPLYFQVWCIQVGAKSGVFESAPTMDTLETGCRQS